MSTTKDNPIGHLAVQIRTDATRAAKRSEDFLNTRNLSHKDVRALNTRLRKMLKLEVYYTYAALLGSNAYIRQVAHRDQFETSTSWQVGLFKEVGKYSVLADESTPHQALAKALHTSGAIIPESIQP